MPQYITLGPLQVSAADPAWIPSRPMPCQLFALLLTRPNRIVSTDSIVKELWDENPPSSALATVQSYIHYIRKKLRGDDRLESNRQLVQTRKPGYLLDVTAGELDSTHFSELATRGRKAFESGHFHSAEIQLNSALNLWQGPALSNVTKGPLLRAHVAHLEECRMAALELRVEVDMKLGRHRELVGELMSLVETHPLNEKLRGQLVTALHRSGRRCEALEEYSRTRRMLNDEFGLEPDTELRTIQHHILTAGVG